MIKKAGFDESLESIEDDLRKKAIEEKSYSPYVPAVTASAIEQFFELGKKSWASTNKKLQKEIDQDPWKFLGKVALISVAVGFVLNRHLTYSKHRKAK